MPRAPSWRLDAAHYPVRGDFQTRFQDMDVNGHLNHVAIATLFESGRVFLNAQVQPLTERPSNVRTMVAAIEPNYLVEGDAAEDRKGVVSGTGGAERVDPGGGRRLTKKKNKTEVSNQ